MTNDMQREYQQLQAMGRYKIWRTNDGEVVIPGYNGQVEPYSLDGQMLAAYTEKPIILNRLLALPFAIPHQVGQSEGSILFSVEHFATIAKLLRLRKKRPRPSPEQIAQAKGFLVSYFASTQRHSSV
jgi:hypothetical protein